MGAPRGWNANPASYREIIGGRMQRVFLPKGIGRITPRQEEIYAAFGEGASVKELSRRYNLAENTVRTHLAKVRSAHLNEKLIDDARR